MKHKRFARKMRGYVRHLHNEVAGWFRHPMLDSPTEFNYSALLRGADSVVREYSIKWHTLRKEQMKAFSRSKRR